MVGTNDLAGFPEDIRRELARARAAAEEAIRSAHAGPSFRTRMKAYRSDFINLVRAWAMAYVPALDPFQAETKLSVRVAERVRADADAFNRRLAELFAAGLHPRAEIEQTIEEAGLGEFFWTPPPSAIYMLAEATCRKAAADPGFPYAPQVSAALRDIGSYWIPPDDFRVEDRGSSTDAFFAARLMVDGRDDPVTAKLISVPTLNNGPFLASSLLGEFVLPLVAGRATDAVVRVVGWTVLASHNRNRDEDGEFGRLMGLCIILERIQGPTLEKGIALMSGERFAAAIAGRLSEAVGALHALGATHCDLSKRNIVFRRGIEEGMHPEDAARHVVVLDFGSSSRLCHRLDDALAVVQLVRDALGGDGDNRRPLQVLLEVESAAKRASGGVRSTAAAHWIWAALKAWRRHVASKPIRPSLLERCVAARGGPLPLMDWEFVMSRRVTEQVKSALLQLGKARAEDWMARLPEHERLAMHTAINAHQTASYEAQWIRPGEPVVGLVDRDIDESGFLRTPTFGAAFADGFFSIPAGGAVLWRGFSSGGSAIVSSADANNVLALPPHPTSIEPQVAFKFAKPDGQGPATVLELHVPAGMPALPVFALGQTEGNLRAELELVLPPSYYRLDFAQAYRAAFSPTSSACIVVPAKLERVGRMLPTRGPRDSSSRDSALLSMSRYLLRPMAGRKRTWTMSADIGRFVAEDPADPGRVFRQHKSAV